MDIEDLFDKHSIAYYDANEAKTQVLTKRKFEHAVDEITKQLEIQENYNNMLKEELDLCRDVNKKDANIIKRFQENIIEYQKENEQLKQGLHGIYNLCDEDNLTHENIWRIANELLH